MHQQYLLQEAEIGRLVKASTGILKSKHLAPVTPAQKSSYKSYIFVVLIFRMFASKM